MSVKPLWIGILLLLGSTASHAEDSPDAILEHTRAVYGALTSYADTGTVLYEYSPTVHDDYTFSTAYNRNPRHFLLDFRTGSGGRIVIWADPDAFHVWWKTTGQVTEYPNPNNSAALTLSDFPTKAVSTKIPALLYGKAGLPGAFLHFVPARDAGLEDCGEKKCHRLEGETSDTYGGTGKQVNVRKFTVWIESDTYLVRKTMEEAPAPAGALNRTTTTFVPQVNPHLADEVFKFSPPK